MANPNQYFLLADHIKLSLLERQRAITLKLEPTSQDGHISRSLESLKEGLEKVTAERLRLQDAGETSKSLTLQETEHSLSQQYKALSSQFHGHNDENVSPTITHPNDPSLSSDFVHATNRPRITSSTSFAKKKSLRDPTTSLPSPKSVRFTDNPLSSTSPPDHDPNRASLFPYRDDPSSTPDHSQLDNQQIHAYHSQVLRDQDEQLDRLGESIGRQRELSIRIGDELDEHVQMLDEVDGNVDRHQGRLDTARKNLGSVARKAKDNMQMTIIVVLIVILVLLIVILK